jgi:hypothetical protein
VTVPKSPNYRKPIKGLGDILASIWRGKKGREAKRRARRESLRWMTSWWYDPKHYWGLRHTQDGSVHAGPTAAAPSVVTP